MNDSFLANSPRLPSLRWLPLVRGPRGRVSKKDRGKGGIPRSWERSEHRTSLAETHPRLRAGLRHAHRHLPHGAPRLALAIAAPKVARSIQRDRDLETFHRGMQYRRAIQLYYRKFHAYPPNVEALVNTNDIRFLRKKYIDPITGQDDWKPNPLRPEQNPHRHGLLRPAARRNASTLAGTGPGGGAGLPGLPNSNGSAFGGFSTICPSSSIFGSSDTGSNQSPPLADPAQPTAPAETGGGAGSTGSTSSGQPPRASQRRHKRSGRQPAQPSAARASSALSQPAPSSRS
jgi:type II secretory pathway pseudopilin PulG